MKTSSLILHLLNFSSILCSQLRRSAFGYIPSKSSKYPYTSQVLILTSYNSDEDQDFWRTGTCTGTVVAPKVVLTAGHCFDLAEYTARRVTIQYGGFYYNDDLSQTDARKWTKHPNYAKKTGVDLAVVITSAPINIPCDQMVFPEKWDLTKNVLTHDRNTFMCGWGRDELGKKDSLKCIEHKAVHLECHLRGNFTWCVSPTPIRLNNGSTVWQTACHGDSGAGVFWKILCEPESDYRLVAVLKGIRTGGAKIGCGRERDDIVTYLEAPDAQLNEWVRHEIDQNGGTKCPPNS